MNTSCLLWTAGQKTEWRKCVYEAWWHHWHVGAYCVCLQYSKIVPVLHLPANCGGWKWRTPSVVFLKTTLGVCHFCPQQLAGPQTIYFWYTTQLQTISIFGMPCLSINVFGTPCIPWVCYMQPPPGLASPWPLARYKSCLKLPNQFLSLIIFPLCQQLTLAIFQPAWVQKVLLTLGFASLEAFYCTILSAMPISPTCTVYWLMHWCIPLITLKPYW